MVQDVGSYRALLLAGVVTIFSSSLLSDNMASRSLRDWFSARIAFCLADENAASLEEWMFSDFWLNCSILLHRLSNHCNGSYQNIKQYLLGTQRQPRVGIQLGGAKNCTWYSWSFLLLVLITIFCTGWLVNIPGHHGWLSTLAHTSSPGCFVHLSSLAAGVKGPSFFALPKYENKVPCAISPNFSCELYSGFKFMRLVRE